MLEYSIGSSLERDDFYAALSFDKVQWGDFPLSEAKKM